jgi:hypothetical protein
MHVCLLPCRPASCLSAGSVNRSEPWLVQFTLSGVSTRGYVENEAGSVWIGRGKRRVGSSGFYLSWGSFAPRLNRVSFAQILLITTHNSIFSKPSLRPSEKHSCKHVGRNKARLAIRPIIKVGVVALYRYIAKSHTKSSLMQPQ